MGDVCDADDDNDLVVDVNDQCAQGQLEDIITRNDMMEMGVSMRQKIWMTTTTVSAMAQIFARLVT